MAHNKGYVRTDGTYVAPFDDKRLSARVVVRAPRPAAKPEPVAPAHRRRLINHAAWRCWAARSTSPAGTRC